jgi:UDP-N-acetylmuramoyl-L-alanyl-D-glutamate--2,6-diaminopimelate ligase
MLQSNSKKINKGDTFIALKGINDDGHNYIEDAISMGASKVIVEHGNYSVDTIIVDDTNKYLDNYIEDNYVDINIIGVTGTNGKTTTCYLVYQLLNELGLSCAYIGTLGYIYNDINIELDNTTPSKLELYNLLVKSKYLGCNYVVMEISSQALDQDRVNFIKLKYIIYTNITRDHLDYHKTLSNYIDSKLKIFNLLDINGISLINNDDKYSNKFKLYNYKTYGYKDSDYTIDKYNNINGNKYTINLIGKHNMYNVLASISLLYEMGYTYNELKNIVPNLKAPSGRMEVINYNTNKIIIDYAHTPDAVENVLKSIKEITTGCIITIIGCGGNRDKGKRKMMGEIATKMSTYVIFTSDNPRFENPLDILNDITVNLDKNNYEIEVNRENAIKKGIQLLDNNDILMLLGKGHEKYQIIGDTKIPFDDKQIVLNTIK